MLSLPFRTQSDFQDFVQHFVQHFVKVSHSGLLFSPPELHWKLEDNFKTKMKGSPAGHLGSILVSYLKFEHVRLGTGETSETKGQSETSL